MLTQKLRKLRRMPIAEMACRFSDVRRRQQERRIWKRTQSVFLPEVSAGVDPRSFIQACGELILGCQQIEIGQLHERFTQRHEILTDLAGRTAQGVLSGKWPMLGHEFDLRGEIDWHRDLRSDFSWERTFYGDLSIGASGHDVKYVWEISRHQYLVDLSRGWRLAGDQAAAETIEKHLASWIENNPVYEGVHWASALEVAMRSISWIWTLAAMEDRIGSEPNQVRCIANSLAEHATYLEHHLSYYSSPFNHLIGEAVGLYLISNVLRQHECSDRWRKLSRTVLVEHTERQFYSDGFSVEQAVGYHFYTLGFLSLAIVAARREGCPLTEIEPVVHRAFQAGAALRQPDGRWPNIGDLDSARSLPVHHQDYWRFGSLCSLGAVLFDDVSLIIDDDPGDELYWLLGAGGVKAWHDLSNPSRSDEFDSTSSRQSESRQHLLMDSGYVVAAGRNDWLLFDVGPIAGGLFKDSTPSTAHGHADTLQVLYWMDGKELLTDSGIESYADRNGAAYFRSPAAHNTIEIENAPVAKNAGKLAWSNVTKRPELNARLHQDCWLAHGRMVLSSDVVVDRYLLGIPNSGLWITDRIRSATSRAVAWNWQIDNPEYQESGNSKSLHYFNDSGVSLKFWANSEIGDWKLIAASNDTHVGWKANDYGVKKPGQRLSLRMQCKGSLLLTTFVGRTASPCKLERVSVDEHLLDCAKQERPGPEINRFGAEIAWVIAEGREQRTYLAGLPDDTTSPLPNARPILGIGNWSVSCLHESDTGAATSQGGKT